MIENKHFDWLKIEENILKEINESDYYASSNFTENYSIIMPPPNVTGYLHMGHALVTTLQDVLVRYHRMQQKNVLWQPGVDHAGIATQVVVEKQLAQQGIKRHDLGRETFIEKVYEWKDKSANTIIDQIKRMGSSCDLSYLAFTMDSQSIKGVNKAFAELYKAGLIYRANRLVNWDCKLQTAISDLEVEQREVKSHLYYINYALVNGSGFITIATTRPETLFADSAIAVNGLDDRFINLVGQEVYIPLIKRKIKIIADDYADMEKGSGAVKITPGHDFNDFEVGERNNLEVINILNKDGTLNEFVPANYVGLTIEKARKQIIVDLEASGNLERIDDYTTTAPYGDRTGIVIEPLLTKQWFIDAKALSKDAIDAVKSGKIVFVPENWKNLYFDWMENIKPWCISRQLWWGHRIPVWYCDKYFDTDGKFFVAETEIEALQQAKEFYKEDVILRQDEDVLDTWFSSSLWPFLTLGWPEKTDKLAQFYPTNVLVTAFDIIFFWVARMIMMGMFFMGDVPFRTVYIHALIRDEHGQKMSKSKGNVVDPLNLIEKYGTDALRFSLVYYSGQGRDIKLAEKTIEGYRNFVTKIWNSYKFAMQNGAVFNNQFSPQSVTISVNHFILYKLQQLQQKLDEYYTSYKFNDVAIALYQFIWGDFCDWYLEFSKAYLYNELESEENKTEVRQTMGFVLDGILALMHPVMPFISQYLYENLHNTKVNLATLKFPFYNFVTDSKEVTDVDKIITFVSKIRSMRMELNLSPAVFLKVYMQNQLPNYLLKNLQLVKKMARLELINSVEVLPATTIQDVVLEEIISIDIEGFLDIEKETLRLNKNKQKLNLELEKILVKLNNNDFMSKATKEVVDNFMVNRVEIENSLSKIDYILGKFATL